MSNQNKVNQVARVGDMGEPYKLQLTREDDGDIIVSILPIGHKWSDVAVQFCCGPGGGTRSHRTGLALGKLFDAMQADIAESLGQFVAEPEDLELERVTTSAPPNHSPADSRTSSASESTDAP